MEPGIVNEYPPIRCCVYLYQVRRHTLDRSGRIDDRNVRLQPCTLSNNPWPRSGVQLKGEAHVVSYCYPDRSRSGGSGRLG
jgi:hypothetical protein